MIKTITEDKCPECGHELETITASNDTYHFDKIYFVGTVCRECGYEEED